MHGQTTLKKGSSEGIGLTAARHCYKNSRCIHNVIYLAMALFDLGMYWGFDDIYYLHLQERWDSIFPPTRLNYKRYNKINVFCHWNPPNLFNVQLVLLQNSTFAFEVIAISSWRSFTAKETRKTAVLLLRTITGACKRLTNFRGLCCSSKMNLDGSASFGWQTRETACLPLQGQLESLHYSNRRWGTDQFS